jgi:hypothetical protein
MEIAEGRNRRKKRKEKRKVRNGRKECEGRKVAKRRDRDEMNGVCGTK